MSDTDDAITMSDNDDAITTSDTDDAVTTSNLEDAIIRVASYHRRDFNLAVIHSDIAQDNPELSLFKSFGRNPISNLGRLEALPTELLTTVLLMCDIQSAFRFSHVNNRARTLVASMWEYRKTREHALQCLWAAFKTNMAPNVGVSALYQALVTETCSLCGAAFGRFFFLPTATQCCLPCLERAPELAVLSLAQVCKATGRSRASLRQLLPVLHTIPGIYGMWETNRKRRGYFVSKAHCSEVLKVDLQEPLPTTTANPEPPLARYMAASSIPYLDMATGDIQIGLSCKGCQAMLEATSTFSIEPFRRLRDKIYSREEFLAHFQQCHGAKVLWMSSKGGTVPFEEPEFTKRGGYFAERP